MTLVSKSSIHHIGLGNLTSTKNMCWITIHHNIIFLNNSNTTNLIIICFSMTLSNVLLRLTMVLLALDNMTS
jgi:hypothetical protein